MKFIKCDMCKKEIPMNKFVYMGEGLKSYFCSKQCFCDFYGKKVRLDEDFCEKNNIKVQSTEDVQTKREEIEEKIKALKEELKEIKEKEVINETEGNADLRS